MAAGQVLSNAACFIAVLYGPGDRDLRRSHRQKRGVLAVGRPHTPRRDRSADVVASEPDAPTAAPPHRSILGMRVDRTSYADAVDRIARWATAHESRYVCVASVNNVMEAHDRPSFMRVMNEADLVTPDGMPLVWGLRSLGARGATRVYGPNLTLKILERAAADRIPIALYGGAPDVVEELERWVSDHYPAASIVYSFSPPFRPLTEDEDAEVVRSIDQVDPGIVLVGLGCPKQEEWMAQHRGRVRAVMVGVGAAFDFLTNRKRQAPRWLRAAGLEWMFRLATEPRRLWRRYLRQNPRFVVLFGTQLLRWKFADAYMTRRSARKES